MGLTSRPGLVVQEVATWKIKSRPGLGLGKGKEGRDLALVS